MSKVTVYIPGFRDVQATRETVYIQGVGYVKVDSEENEVPVCMAIAADGTPANVSYKKVYRNKKAAREGYINSRKYYLKKIIWRGYEYFLFEIDPYS